MNTTLGRRVILGALLSSGILTALRPLSSRASPVGSAPALPWRPGLQLYTLQLTAKDDLARALHEVRDLGYVSVELPGNYGRSAEELRRLLDEANLTCPSVHVAPSPAFGVWSIQDDLGKSMEILGARYVVLPVPLLPGRINDALRQLPGERNGGAVSKIFDSLDRDDWLRTAELLNRRARSLKAQGIRVGYHNHGVDFVPLADKRTGFDTIISHTDPSLVSFELDLGWAVSAGQNLDILFERLGKRLKMLHLKDLVRPSKFSMELDPAVAGTGIIDWTHVAALVRDSSIEHMFVEQEPPFTGTPMEAAHANLEFLEKLFGAHA